MKNLSEEFFIINNIDKDSGIINVSFSNERPSKFIDCGITRREFSNARGENVYSYNPADQSQYTFVDDNGISFNAFRSTRLTGIVNIFVAEDNGVTSISVNAKYVIQGNIKYYNVYNQFTGEHNWTYDLSTTQPSEPAGELVKCVSKGVVESKIISFVQPQ